MSANAKKTSSSSPTIATTNADGMVVFSLQDLNADVLGQVAGVGLSSSSSSSSGRAAQKFHHRHQPNNSNATTMDEDSHPSKTTTADGNVSDEENSVGAFTSTTGTFLQQPTATKSNANAKSKKPSRNAASYRPGPGRRSNNLRPHPTRYRLPFLQNGGGSGGGSGKGASHGLSPAGSSSSSSTNSSSVSVSVSHASTTASSYRSAAAAKTKRAPPPIKTAIRFEEDETYSYKKDGGSAAAAIIATTSTATTTSTPGYHDDADSAPPNAPNTTSAGMMMSSPPPPASGRRSSGGGRYRPQRTPHPHTQSADRHPDVHDGNIYGAITFASTPEAEEDGTDDKEGGSIGSGSGNGGTSRRAHFAGSVMSGGSRGGGGHGSGSGSGATTKQKQQYRKTPHWKKKVATSTASTASATDASKAKTNAEENTTSRELHQYQGDYDYETGLMNANANTNTNKNDADHWYSPFSSPAPTSQYDYECEEYHQPPQAPPTDDEGKGSKGKMTTSTMMPSAALDYVHSTRVEVAPLTTPNVRALSAMARPWESSRIKTPSSSAAASASASASTTPMSTGGTSYGTTTTNDFQILSPKSDLTSNATKTPSTGGTRGSSGGDSAASRSSFVSPTTEQLASWASGASPTSPSVASVLEKSLLSPGSTPSNGATIVQSAGGSIGIGDVSRYLLSSVSVDIASPTAVDKTDAAICFRGGGSSRGILSPTTTIASEDAFTPSLRVDESGSGDTVTVKNPGDEVNTTTGTSTVDASTLTLGATSTPSVPKMVEARTQTEDVAGQDLMKMGNDPKSQGHTKTTTMSPTAAVFTPSSKMSIAATARALSSTTASVRQRQYQKQQTQTRPGAYGHSHAYASTASSTPAPILSAKTQLAYIPTEINGIIHYVPTHVVLPAESPYSYTQHFPIQTMASGAGASIAAESAAAARGRKPCHITCPASNGARAKATAMNALAREFEPSPN